MFEDLGKALNRLLSRFQAHNCLYFQKYLEFLSRKEFAMF